MTLILSHGNSSQFTPAPVGASKANGAGSPVRGEPAGSTRLTQGFFAGSEVPLPSFCASTLTTIRSLPTIW